MTGSPQWHFRLIDRATITVSSKSRLNNSFEMVNDANFKAFATQKRVSWVDSLCNLCVLCHGGENLVYKTHHRDTENTEVAQSKGKTWNLISA
jgi:hypothetical protein